jgi:hypothetical protein
VVVLLHHSFGGARSAFSHAHWMQLKKVQVISKVILVIEGNTRDRKCTASYIAFTNKLKPDLKDRLITLDETLGTNIFERPFL